MAIWPVILSGGVGARLWPLSRAESPKQLLPLVEARSMIAATAARVSDRTRFHPPIVVCGALHADRIAAELADCSPRIIAEPAARNTAPAIALAALAARADDPDALILVMPSDHAVAGVDAFLAAVEAATPLAAGGWLMTFGIRPERPETGYGYIRLGEAVARGAHAVARFIEKPPLADAQAYVADGQYAWNGGIFLMRADRYLEALGQHAPAILAAAERAMAGADRAGGRIRPDAAAFGASPSDSIDYAVMEKAERVGVVPVDMGWSDIGSWDALHAAGAPDGDGNVIRGDVLAIGATDCLLRSEGPLVAAVGIEGVTVVATADAVLVAARGRAQEVKAVVDRLKADGRAEVERHAHTPPPTPALPLSTPPGMAFRPYRTADRAAALSIFESNVPEYFAASETPAFAASIDALDGPAFVITEADRVIAYGGYGVGDLYNRISLRWGISARDVHGRGIGSALLWARIAHMLMHAPPRRWLAVDTIPEIAPFFERNGFERLPDWDDGYCSGFAMAQLRLKLEGVDAAAARVRAESALAHAARPR